MRLPLLFLAVLSASAQTVPHTPRGPAASPETLAWQRYAAQSKASLAALNRTPPAVLPPLPAGVVDLAYTDFFAPIGDRGLEYSEKLRALAGQRVRLVGYMVREATPATALFRLAPWPVTVEANGLCNVDDTPPTTVHVIPASNSGKNPWQPGRLILIGRLEVGFRAAADGGNSHVRLVLDHAEAPRP